MAPSFDNLSDFFNYIEFCPLCKSRLIIYAALPSIDGSTEWCFLNNTKLEFLRNNFTINTSTNCVSEDYKNIKKFNNTTVLVVGKQCKKWHFLYSGSCNIIKDKLIVADIIATKYHFVRILKNSTHFAVDSDLTKMSTRIRITKDFSVKEVFLPLIDFDFTSKKQIDIKLKKILILA